jgi:Flp pilus assembly protein TadD
MLMNHGAYTEAENAAVTYLGQNAEDARGWRLLGDIYLKWNKRADAIRAYEKAYDYGKANDAGIIRGLVYLLKSDRVKLNQRRHDIDSLLNDYGYAIEHNTHFIALGTNVEEAVSLAELLAQIYPTEADVYEALAVRMAEHAAEERTRLASRPRGLLW